jgi:hypothetical protein
MLPVAGIVVLGLVAAVVVLFMRGSGGDAATPAAAAVEAPRGPSAEYVTAVKGPLGRLTDSAQVTGRVLTRASGEEDVAGVGRMATQQLAVVQNARARIADIETGPRERTARGALSRATQAHRTYLASLARLADADAETAPDRVPQIRTQARRMLERYRVLFTELPTVPKGITTSGVGDLAGLRQALTARQRAAEQAAEEAEAAERAAEEAEIEESTARSSSSSGAPSFQSPTGNLRCEDLGGTLFCSSSNDGFGVTLPAVGAPATGPGIASGGQTVPYGSSWSSGVFTCDSAFDGITCRNASGNGFFLNRTDYRPF